MKHPMVPVIPVLVALVALLLSSCEARFESLLPPDGGSSNLDGGVDAGAIDTDEPTR